MDDKPRYFDHEADIGIIGYGETMERAFEDSALSLFQIITDGVTAKKEKSVEFEFQENDYEIALVTFLNKLLAYSRVEKIIFGHFKLQHQKDKWSVQAWGEAWRDSLAVGTEVKGATLTSLAVSKQKNQWIAKCVVDV